MQNKTKVILCCAIALICLGSLFLINNLPQESVSITHVVPQIINLRG
jgi:hypothetical protein